MKKDNWIIKAFLMTFFIALIFNGMSNVVVSKCNIFILILLSIIFVIIGIIFDIIGTAVLSANESTFHSMSSMKVKGAKESVMLIKNSNRIASICNDVIGDICGIVSGSVAAIIGIHLSSIIKVSSILITIIVSSLISSLTVGGKAIGKKYAIKNADKIIKFVGKIKSMFSF